MAWALEFSGYESKFVVGTEGHNGKHCGAILPDALRWLRQDYPKPIAKPAAGSGDRHFISTILHPGADWELTLDREGYLYVVTNMEFRFAIHPVGWLELFLFRSLGTHRILHSAERICRRFI